MPSQRIGPGKTTPRKSRNDPTAAKTGANDGPGMWIPAGVFGGTGILPRRAGGAARRRRTV